MLNTAERCQGRPAAAGGELLRLIMNSHRSPLPLTRTALTPDIVQAVMRGAWAEAKKQSMGSDSIDWTLFQSMGSDSIDWTLDDRLGSIAQVQLLDINDHNLQSSF
jgi:hypothetical protein